VDDTTQINRLEAFSDGVFAIAITLLVLELRLPQSTDTGEGGRLLTHLLELWPTYLAYITSFITIGIMWANHHAMFQIIRRTDRNLLMLNVILLMFITFFNFPTVVVAEYFQAPDGRIAALFYSGTLFVIGIFFNVTWWYAARNPHLLDPQFDQGRSAALTRQYSIGTTLYLIAFVLAFFSVTASVGMCLLLAVFFAFPLRPARRN
jgi:uncharacterized membrane protein